MSHFRTILALTLSALISLPTLAETVEKTTTVETTVVPADAVTSTTAVSVPAASSLSGRSMIVTPVPSAKETISTPQGYVSCFNVEAGWNKNAWVPEHRVCQYENTPGQQVTYNGVAWVEGYWSCTQYTDTACTKWEWKTGHWVKTLEVY